MTRRLLCLPLLLVLLCSSATSGTAARVGSEAEVRQSFRSSPVMFIENVGQWDAGAHFQVSGGTGTMWLAEDAIWITLVEKPTDDHVGPQLDPSVRFEPPSANIERGRETRKVANIRVSFVGANAHPRIEPLDPLDTTVSYFLGNDPSKWRPDVPVWGGVRYVDLYPGVDLELTGEGGRMVQRLPARPGADLAGVQLRVEGADAVTADGGTFRISTAAGEVAYPLLRVTGTLALGVEVQPVGAQVFDVAAPFAPAVPGLASREAGGPQATVTAPQAVADNPADLIYGTFLGGDGLDRGYDIAVDATGSAYVTGQTMSSDFPITPGSHDTSLYGTSDAFVAKLNPAGSGLAYATFLGGIYDENGYGIAVDGAGSAYITGSTYSDDFPTTPGGFDTNRNGGEDAFVVKLNPTGSGLAYATLLGGSSSEYGWGIAVDGMGNSHVTGSTRSTDFPATPWAFDTSYSGGTFDAFVVELNPSGSGLAYATFLGGGGDDHGYGIAVDGMGNTHVTGSTMSTDFPTTPGAFDTSLNGNYDAFVIKLNPAGGELAYATFLGGSDYDRGGNYGIALDGAGSAYVTGPTYSADFPTTPGAFDTSFNGASPYHDSFVVKLEPNGGGLAYATFLGGSYEDYGYDIAVDRAGSAYVTGSPVLGFPTTPGAFDTSLNGDDDVFVVKLNPGGNELAYATFLGGGDYDYIGNYGIALDGAGSAYVTGGTHSTDFPTTPGAFDTSFNGYYDVFVVKLTMTGTGGGLSISGAVSAAGQPVGDVLISAGSAGSVSTDVNGAYTMARLAAGTYTITPSKPGYSFSPPSRTVSVSRDVSEEDFYGVATTPFLDLPFAYDGTQASFVTVLYDEDHGGRVRSWFDHDVPTYGKNKAILLYDGRELTKLPYNPGLGCYEGRCYDGHNGLDFQYADPQAEAPGYQPLFISPAADGVVANGGVASACNDTCRYPSCIACGSYGNYVVVNHQNGYFTRYAHLSSVSVSADQPVTADDILGTMGTTGHSTGVHLHFSVHLDSNGNGQWDGESVDKPIDPCGYLGEGDPWVTNGGPVSAQLWEYACAPGQQALVSTSVGATVADVTGRTTAEIPAGALSGSALLNLAPGPVAGASAQLRSTGGSFWLRLLEWLETSSQTSAVALSAPSSMAALQQPITLTVAFDEVAVSHLDVSQLTLRRWDEDQKDWQALPTEVDPHSRIITATSQYLGDYDLQAPLLCTTDPQEPDDGYGSAAPFWPNDRPVARGLDIPGDGDWVRFHALEGAPYTIRTLNLAGGADTVLTLYDTDGLTALASSDNMGSDPASEITWTAPYGGSYFVEVTSAPGGATGCSATYQLSISTSNSLAMTIASNTEGALLTWPRDPKYAGYQVRRNTTPSFTANDWSDLLTEIPTPASGDTVSYLDAGAFDPPSSSYFYIVLPTNADAEPYLVSNRAGVFNFALRPGTSP